MIESEEFPISEKPVPSPQRRFKVVKPAKNKWIIISLICTGFYISWFFLIRALDPNPGAAAGLVTGLIAISVLSVLLSLFMWKRVGKWTIRKIVLETLHQHKNLNDKRILSEEGEEKNNLSFSKKLVALLSGININDGVLYYVEEGAYTADVSSIKYLMKTKMFDLLSACLGIGFLIAAFARLFIEDIFVGIMAGSITILLSPILASWILPVLWTLRDARLKFLTPRMDNFDLAEKVRRSILSRFLGFSGLFAGIGFLFDLLPETMSWNPNTYREIVLAFLLAIGALFIIIILLTGTASLVTIIYLSKMHEKKVNDLRNQLNEFLPKGITNVMFTKSSFI